MNRTKEQTKGTPTKVENRYGCGCLLETTRNPRVYTFTMCPKHKAAPQMYEALKEMLVDWQSGDIEINHSTRELIDKALAKANGQ